MKSLLLLMGLALITHFTHANQTTETDSLIASRKTEPYVTHRVSGGETLYSLMRHFQCSRKDFDALNPQMKGSNVIKINQTLKFPAAVNITTTTSAETQTAKETIEHSGVTSERSAQEINSEETPKVIEPKITTIHTVADDETLYSICKKYEVDIDEVKRINNLMSNDILIGQTLMIRRNGSEIQTGFPKNLMPDIKPTRMVVPEGKLAKKVEEAGIAELIPTGKKSDQMLALHKSAPLGSLMLVKNVATGRQVVVKVIGKLPDTGNNENTLVRLSPSAFYKLNPKDIKFSAEVTYYMPPENL